MSDSGMRYIWQSDGEKGAPMHVELRRASGRGTMRPLCGKPGEYDRSINAPWTLGRGLCPDCQKTLDFEVGR